MENRRRQKWDKNGRSQNYRKPPRAPSSQYQESKVTQKVSRHQGSWQPTVPSWEKDFCRVVGAMDWETLLQLKKFAHLYENVMKWDDSAGEEAFNNAKKRYWAQINGYPCDIPLPDPDLHNDKIDWDSQTDMYDPDLPSDLDQFNAEDGHEPVIIFGDSFIQNQSYSPAGWGDDEENFKVPASSSSANHGGNNGWEQNWGYQFENGAPVGWPGCYSNVWGFADGGGYTGWGDHGWSNNGWNNDGGWNYYPNNNVIYELGPNTVNNDGGCVSSNRTPRIQGNNRYRNNNMSRNDDGRHKARPYVEKRTNQREWNNSFNSWTPVGHNAAMTIGQKWNQ